MHKKYISIFIGVFIICCLVASQSAAADTRIMPALAGPSAEQPRVSIHAGTGKVRFLAAPAEGSMLQPSFVAPDADSESAARTFLSTYAGLFGISSPEQELLVKKAKRRSVKFRQVYQGIPVIAGELVVNLDLKKNVRSVNGEISPEINLSTTPAFSAKEAKAKALAVVAKKHGIDKAELFISEKELSVYNPVLIGQSDRNTNYLVWRFEVKSQNGMIREFVLIDAMTGMTHLSFNQVDAARNRSIYDNQNLDLGLPGIVPVRIEGGAASVIQDVNDAYDFLGDTYDFYSSHHGRDSIDGLGMPLIATVRYCDSNLPSRYCPYPNAYWNGAQMVFGQGFVADDVVGHELTHGVTEHESNLFYYMQAGAINESLSDVWGEFIDLTNGKGTDTSAKRWLMGEDIAGGALRSMKNPPQFNDPDSMLSALYSCKSGDGGGVHTNSGVNNKAAFLMVDGGTFGGQTVAGVSGATALEKIQKVAKLYYEVQTDYLTPGSDYQDLADALIQSCEDLQIAVPQVMTSADCVQVEKAVNAVHMQALPSKCRNIDVPLCNAGSPTDLFFDDLENPVSGNWTQSAVTGGEFWSYPQNPNPIIDIWGVAFDATYATSGVFNFWGYDYGGTIDPMTGFWNGNGVADFYIAMTQTAQNQIGPLPSNSFMLFNHAYDFEDGNFGGIRIFFDGGVLEYSTNNGATWTDAENLLVINGYDGKLDARFGNPLPGRKAFAGSSHGYITTKLDLSPLAGNTVRFRYRIGTDVFGDGFGWFIDDIRLYTCSEPAPTTVALDSPTGGEIFANGDTVTIQWEGPVNMAYVNLSYSVDNGATWKTIEKNLQGSSFDWPIPLQSNNKAKSLIKVSAYDDKGKLIGTAKSGAFAVEVVRLTSPNGSESLDEGSTHAVTWTANTTKGPVTKVQLSYSTDNGVSWKSIPSDNMNDGSLDWILPSVSASKTKSKVKIVLKDAKGNTVGSDISDGLFTIVNNL